MEFATCLYDLAGPGSEKKRIVAPLTPKGAAHAVLVVAFEHLAVLSDGGPAERKKFCLQIISQVTTRMGIRSIPMAPPIVG